MLFQVGTHCLVLAYGLLLMPVFYARLDALAEEMDDESPTDGTRTRSAECSEFSTVSHLVQWSALI